MLYWIIRSVLGTGVGLILRYLVLPSNLPLGCQNWGEIRTCGDDTGWPGPRSRTCIGDSGCDRESRAAGILRVADHTPTGGGGC